jgi:poly(hydroxyalkanoate) granule-associated protein
MIRKAKEMQAGMTESAYRIWLAGLGAVAYAQENGTKLFNDLIKRGREMEARTKLPRPEMGTAFKGATGRAATAWQQLGKGVDEQVTAALHRMGVPTRHEIATLSKRVELLTASIEKLKPKSRALAKPIERTRPATPAKS